MGFEAAVYRHFEDAAGALKEVEEDPSKLKSALDFATRGVLDLTFAQVCYCCDSTHRWLQEEELLDSNFPSEQETEFRTMMRWLKGTFI